MLLSFAENAHGISYDPARHFPPCRVDIGDSALHGCGNFNAGIPEEFRFFQCHRLCSEQKQVKRAGNKDINREFASENGHVSETVFHNGQSRFGQIEAEMVKDVERVISHIKQDFIVLFGGGAGCEQGKQVQDGPVTWIFRAGKSDEAEYRHGKGPGRIQVEMCSFRIEPQGRADVLPYLYAPFELFPRGFGESMGNSPVFQPVGRGEGCLNNGGGRGSKGGQAVFLLRK